MPKISKRSAKSYQSPIRKLARFADQAEADGKNIYYLNIGQPDIPFPVAAQNLLRSLELDILAYSPALGRHSLRQKMTEYYGKFGIGISIENILITTGGSEAIAFAITATSDPGNNLVVSEPLYALYNGFAEAAGVHIRAVTSHLEDGFRLPSVSAFEDQIDDHTRAVLLCNPSNPTGHLYEKEDLMALAALARKHDLFLIVDEVYREFCYDGLQHFSALNLQGMEDYVIVVDSLSKRYSICGARIGTLVTRNKKVMEAVTKYAEYRLSSPSIAQMVAEVCLEESSEYMEEVITTYDARRRLMYNRLKNMEGVICHLPKGAFYMIARLPVDNVDWFNEWLLTSFQHDGCTLMLSACEGFYATPDLGRQEARLAYVLNEDHISHAMDCLQIALEEYPGKT